MEEQNPRFPVIDPNSIVMGTARILIYAIALPYCAAMYLWLVESPNPIAAGALTLLMALVAAIGWLSGLDVRIRVGVLILAAALLGVHATVDYNSLSAGLAPMLIISALLPVVVSTPVVSLLSAAPVLALGIFGVWLGIETPLEALIHTSTVMVLAYVIANLYRVYLGELKSSNMRLADALGVVQNKVETVSRQQDRQAEMYAVIGHELRTPAASLQMMLDDLGEGESLDKPLVRANIEQLLSVIDTLRAVAQPERMAQTVYTDVKLDEVLQQQTQSLQALAARQGIKLKTDFGGLNFHPVQIQKTLLRQVLSNLIKNALIHSGGTVLEVGAAGELIAGRREALRLWVADNGQGVSEDKVEALFEAFVRGSTESEGTGLGLHISREIIQKMGGTLRYEPGPQGGACFVIELEVELAKEDPSIENDPKTTLSILQGKRVLLAEDNKTLQVLTQKMLQKQGADVVVANNGALALDAFHKGEFDLLLSDIFMPQMDGYAWVQQVRSSGAELPVIGLTAATIGEETEQMLAAGADAVLSKPTNIQQLEETFAQITKRGQTT